MQYFQYGSRVVENERMLRLKSNVRTVGKAVKAIVNFFVAVLIFVALNTLLHNLAQSTGLFSLSTYRIFVESANIIAYNDALTFVSYLYQHSVCILLSFVFTCACCVCCIIFAMGGKTKAAKGAATYTRNDFSQGAVSSNSVISYRHKVCFLA